MVSESGAPPLAIGEVLVAAARRLIDVRVWALGFLGALTTALLAAALRHGGLRSEVGRPLALNLALVLVATVLGYVPAAITQASIVTAVAAREEARAISLASCVRAGVARMPIVLVANLVTSVLILCGLALFGAPGLVAGVVLFLVTSVASLEDRGPLESIVRSAALTRGSRLRISVLLFVALVASTCAVVLGGAALFTVRDVPLELLGWMELFRSLIQLDQPALVMILVLVRAPSTTVSVTLSTVAYLRLRGERSVDSRALAKVFA